MGHTSFLHWLLTFAWPILRRGQYRLLAGLFWLLISNKVRNLTWDLRHGGWYGGIHRSAADQAGAHAVMSSDVNALDAILPFFPKDETVVDVGSGKGRVIRWLLAHGHRGKIVGAEIDPEVAARSRRHFRNPQVEIIDGSILATIRKDWRFFYLFNPFDAETLSLLLSILTAMHPEGRIWVVYYNSTHLDFSGIEREWKVVNGELEVRANLRRVSVLNLKPTSLWGRLDSQADGSLADAAPKSPGSNGTSSA